jgi:hypothetical protein
MIFGWDVSTSIIGVTVLTDDGRFVTSDHLDLRKSDAEMICKAEEAEVWIRGLLPKHVEPHGAFFTHYVEDRLGSFAAGRTMLQVLMKLAAFNMVVSYIIHRVSCELAEKDSGGASVRHIHPSTAKAIMKKEGLIIPKGADKKQLTLDFVSKKEPSFVVDKNRNDNPQPWCYDRADSYIVARAGYLRRYLSKDATGTKASGDPADAGTRAHHQG